MQIANPLTGLCNLCPRDCGIDRNLQRGYCGANNDIEINLGQIHHGEEPVISGSRGSGTIFFSHCNLKCVFCQNYGISQLGWGSVYSTHELAQMMLDMQEKGAHNVNLVSPGHYQAQIMQALEIAKTKGMSLPVVWNSNAYEKVESLKALEGLVDIYLPDCKYSYGIYSKRYSGTEDYPERALAAIEEMHHQVGDLVLDEAGIATKGLIIRLLVLPKRLSGISKSLDQIAQRLGTGVQLSLMAQYYPTHQAMNYPELSRGITAQEYEEALEAVQALGFERVWIQELSCSDTWTPSFRDPITGQNQREKAL